ncbi:hypothetical protein [Marimonas arenosa]|uniref:Uncharacterized protein n=1 Tax=Marimonas arenosa TaxID=1795305 RepID=A0AAE3WJ96_9RHOB|nr:hypothetical protein [Marimonas arenosa]MDQ2092458.1 hypothetical protein [Marimonas arenosa]
MTEMATHKPCYGKMFPEVPGPSNSDPKTGKVFSFASESMGLAPPTMRAEHSAAEWDDCLKCEDFDSCYKLSTGKLLLLAAIKGK